MRRKFNRRKFRQRESFPDLRLPYQRGRTARLASTCSRDTAPSHECRSRRQFCARFSICVLYDIAQKKKWVIPIHHSETFVLHGNRVKESATEMSVHLRGNTHQVSKSDHDLAKRIHVVQRHEIKLHASAPIIQIENYCNITD